MSGTTPSRWKAYQSPVRHSPVCASSRISSIPRSWHLSLQRREVARRQVEHAARAEDRLDDAGGRGCRPTARRRGRTRSRAAAASRASPSASTKSGPVGVRGRDREVAGRGRAVALAAGAVGGARGGLRHAVPGPGERHDLVAAGDELGHPDRGLVGLRARSSAAAPSRAGRAASRRAARPARRTGRLSMPLKRWSRVPTCSRTVATISGWECPRIALICPEVKSSSSPPVGREQRGCPRPAR